MAHHRTRRRRPLSEIFTRPRSLVFLFKLIVPLILFFLIIFSLFYELHIELMLYSRHWVKTEIKTLGPLAGCFNKPNVSSLYNMTSAMGPKRTEVQAGLPMRFGMDCYDFAGTIRPDPLAPRPAERRLFHTYWRVDLAPFDTRQEWMLKSFFATQDLTASKLILWSNGDLSQNPVLMVWLRRFPEAFEVREANTTALALGTALEGSLLLQSHDPMAWVDGDLLRLLLLWNYGGLWVDMDTLFTRDLSPLLEHEFVTQWDCYDKKYQPFNGALMHFHKHSPYLCEFFHIMRASTPPRAGSTDWGSQLYLKLWRRLVAAGIPPFKVLPFCFSDGRSCRMDNRIPDPFVKDGTTWADGLGFQALEKTLDKVFAVHLHNQWEKLFPPAGWVDRILLTKYESVLG
ncbi:glycosyltransferase family 32 protein [Hysterangium stoloniferum]|nr:glycosyltransferase family 32 protein [Hysterangium stoloniferum]